MQNRYRNGSCKSGTHTPCVTPIELSTVLLSWHFHAGYDRLPQAEGGQGKMSWHQGTVQYIHHEFFSSFSNFMHWFGRYKMKNSYLEKLFHMSCSFLFFLFFLLHCTLLLRTEFNQWASVPLINCAECHPRGHKRWALGGPEQYGHLPLSAVSLVTEPISCN